MAATSRMHRIGVIISSGEEGGIFADFPLPVYYTFSTGVN
jgi:hypothetical protein